VLPDLEVPLVAAPMAGGPSTVDLVVAVSEAGGLGFLAAGYKPVDVVREEIQAVRRRTTRPFGVNVFLPGAPTTDLAEVQVYRARLAQVAARLEVDLGEPRWDDDAVDAKLAAVAGAPVVSLTFGCPSPTQVARLHDAGSAVVVTVTTAEEAELAAAAHPDALWVQGGEAGAHRGGFTEAGLDGPSRPLRHVLPAVGSVTGLPLVAAGGLMDGADVRAVLDAGATWAAMGTAFLGCPEAGTSATHRAALVDPRFDRTAVTRAFTGRPARGLVNDFLRTYGDEAPAAYPEVHHLTRPLRAAAAAAGDADHLHLWAGEGWQRMRAMPAGDLVRTVAAELAAAGPPPTPR
jgi:nitronate monooxygenase